MSHSDKRFVLATESESSVFPSTSKERAAVARGPGLALEAHQSGDAAEAQKNSNSTMPAAQGIVRTMRARYFAQQAWWGAQRQRVAPFLVKYATVYPGTYFLTYLQLPSRAWRPALDRHRTGWGLTALADENGERHEACCPGQYCEKEGAQLRNDGSGCTRRPLLHLSDTLQCRVVLCRLRCMPWMVPRFLCQRRTAGGG